jgi:hypothetical protein
MSVLTKSADNLQKMVAPLSMDALMPTKTWYYRQDGRMLGPMSQESLGELVRLGYVKNEASIWQDGQKERVLSSYPQLMAQMSKAQKPDKQLNESHAANPLQSNVPTLGYSNNSV